MPIWKIGVNNHAANRSMTRRSGRPEHDRTIWLDAASGIVARLPAVRQGDESERFTQALITSSLHGHRSCAGSKRNRLGNRSPQVSSNRCESSPGGLLVTGGPKTPTPPPTPRMAGHICIPESVRALHSLIRRLMHIPEAMVQTPHLFPVLRTMRDGLTDADRSRKLRRLAGCSNLPARADSLRCSQNPGGG